jgi:hypothetical protein
MLDLPVNNISGIGSTMVKVLNENSIYYVKDALCETFSLNKLINMFDDRIGRFLFLAFRGIDEQSIIKQGAPKSIAIEDSMLGITNKNNVYLYLDALSKDLYKRLNEDRLLYNRQPTVLTLKIREKSTGYSGKRITKSAKLPMKINHPNDILKVGKGLFEKIILAVLNKAGWILTLVGLSCTSFEPCTKKSTVSIDSFFHPSKYHCNKRKKNMDKQNNQIVCQNQFAIRDNKQLQPLQSKHKLLHNGDKNNSTEVLLPSYIDASVFNQLPKNIQKEILSPITSINDNSTDIGVQQEQDLVVTKKRTAIAHNGLWKKKRKKELNSITSYFSKKR